MDRAQATLMGLLAVTLFGIGCASGPRPVVWDQLPFPKDSDWPGSKGEPAVMDGNAMVLQGQEVRTRGIYQLPLAIDFDFEIAKGSVPDGGFLFKFAPTNAPTDVDLPQSTIICISYQSPLTASVKSSGALSVFVSDGSSHARSVWGPVPLICEEGQFYHLHIEARTDGLSITTNEKKVEQIDVKIPYGKFFIQMHGWKPPSRWYVRNFTIH
jgi:hypothetical protein